MSGCHRPAVLSLLFAAAVGGAELRPPAVPLVACDPYFSIWSPADRLAEADTTHWTGKPHRLSSLVRIDGQTFRLLGREPADLPALAQTRVEVLPTRTIAEYEGAGIALTLTFLTPALADDLDVLSWPVTYLTWSARATDGREHEVQALFEASAELCVNEPRQLVDVQRDDAGGLVTLRVGSVDQPVLQKKGDDLRIDWGHLYVAAETGQVAAARFLSAEAARAAFAAGEAFPMVKQAMPVPAGEAPRLVLALTPARVDAQPVARDVILAYDDQFSIQYMGQNLRPYWRRGGWAAADLLQAAAREQAGLRARCAAFDAELMADLRAAGGESYARLCALAYRQCFAAGKFVADAHGQPLQFSKENHSNGCIGTSDVFYPMAPQFLLFGPSLAKSFLVPFMNYAASERWRFPFAPHDLGTYPKANGQVYGGGERTEQNQMPVEESGNLLLLFAAVAQMEGHADFAGLYWPQLQRWAAYLQEKGFDPEHQLCTDDFAGHLAHNVNLSAKAICALGAFGQLCAWRGDTGQAAAYRGLARRCAEEWVKQADDGDHYRLAFDKPGSWSQKYNLVWDRILGLDLFPDAVLRKEMDHYRRVQRPYGLPLDNRQTYTKLDWILWTATLTRDRGDFEALVDPVIRFLNATPDRSPMTDWYFTDSARKRGFTARPVVGGVFLQMLYDRTTWKKWAGRERTKAAGWAPIPRPPRVTTVIPTAREQAAAWRYTTVPPATNWMTADADDSLWSSGPGGFGTAGTPGAQVGTEWKSEEIWLRRVIELPPGRTDNLLLRVHHDEEVEIYLNGVRAARAAGYLTDYELMEIAPAAQAVLRPGPNLMAVRCRQTMGGQYVDVGIVRRE